MISYIWIILAFLLVGEALTLDQDEDSAVKRIGKVFFKSYSTRTVYSLSFFTSTVPFTCYYGPVDNGACAGRKRRQLTVPSDFMIADESSIDDLHSSKMEKELDVQATQREPKIFFTLWSTTTSTQTATTFSVNRAVTMSIRLLCTFAGVVYNFC